MSNAQLEEIRLDGIPKTAQKQTQWCTSVWKEWAVYRQTVVIEQSEATHKLLVNIDEISKDDLQYWLVKFVAEVKRKDENHYPPDTIYQICCGFGQALRVAGRNDVDIFDAPEFTRFKDTLDACIEPL